MLFILTLNPLTPPTLSGPCSLLQVYVKYKCGAAPEVCHFYVVLCADRLLARPVEVWQVRWWHCAGHALQSCAF